MADYLTTDAELKSIADAIRTKGGTSETLSFPDGFVSAIEEISGGGGLTVPGTAAAHFQVQISMPSTVSSISIDFSALTALMAYNRTYAWSLILWRNSQLISTEKTYISNNLCFQGRAAGNAFSSNSAKLERTSFESQSSPFVLNNTDFKSGESTSGTVLTVTTTTTATDFSGEYVGIFTLLPPWTDAYSGTPLTTCPDGFLAVESGDASTAAAAVAEEDADYETLKNQMEQIKEVYA